MKFKIKRAIKHVSISPVGTAILNIVRLTFRGKGLDIKKGDYNVLCPYSMTQTLVYYFLTKFARYGVSVHRHITD